MLGTISHIHDDKEPRGRYGFIRDEGGSDRFFHFRDLRGLEFGPALDGARVEFDPVESKVRNGLRATNVRAAQ